jgi:hypothetical protein
MPSWLHPSSGGDPRDRGVLLGCVVIAGMLGLLVGGLLAGVRDGPIVPGLGSVLMALYVMSWGALFIASYFFTHESFLFRGVMWVCEHASRPSGRFMAFFYGALGLGLGGWTLVLALDLR